MNKYSKSDMYRSASLVERGCLGQKTGAGVYKYEKGDYTPQDDVAILLGTGFLIFGAVC